MTLGHTHPPPANMATAEQALEIFRRYAAKLNKTIWARFSVQSLTWELFSGNVISRDVLRIYTSPHHQTATQSGLLQAVMTAIEQDPQRLANFISVLEEIQLPVAQLMKNDLESLETPDQESTNLREVLDKHKQELLQKDQEIKSLKRQRDELQATNVDLRKRLEELSQARSLPARKLVNPSVPRPGYSDAQRPINMDTDCLDVNDLQPILLELTPVVEVRSLGLNLGLHMYAIQKIQEDERTVEKQKMKILNHWLVRKDIVQHREGEVPRWSHIADALERENRALSMSLRRKYCSGNIG